MDFFKKVVGSVGAGKTGCAPNFPYTIQEPPYSHPAGFPWLIYKGQGVKNNEAVTVFVADITTHETGAAAKNMLHRLRTLRHPVVLRYLASAETAKQLFIAVESVVPLSCSPTAQWRQADHLLWLVFDLLKAVRFLNEEAAIIHGNQRPWALFLTVAGELRLGGFELASGVRDDESLLSDFTRYLRNVHRSDWPPELSSPSQSVAWSQVRALPVWAVDSFMLGGLIKELFRDLALPLELAEYVRRATLASPRERQSPAALTDARVFAKVAMIKVAQSLGDVAAIESPKRDALFAHIGGSLDSIPPQYVAYRIAPTLGDLLPQFLAREVSLEGIRLYLRSSARLPDAEITSRMADGLKAILAKPDRAIRLVFLEALPLFGKRLEAGLVQELLYPALVEGFSDSSPMLRESSLKASLLIVPKLTLRQLNGELLRLYARFQSDEQPSIRVNTIVCIGNAAKYLDPGPRKKALISAYTKALGDPFVPVRAAVLAAVPVTMEFLDDEGIAKQLLPAICQLLVDPNRRIRSEAFTVAETLVKRLRVAADDDLGAVEDIEEQEQEHGESLQGMGPAVHTSSPSWTISDFADKLMNVALGSEAPRDQPPIDPDTAVPQDDNGWNVAGEDILGLEITPSPASLARPTSGPGGSSLWVDGDNPWGAVDSGADPWTSNSPAESSSRGHAGRRSQPSGKPLSLARSTKPSLLKDL